MPGSFKCFLPSGFSMETCMNLYSLPYVLHALPTWVILTRWLEWLSRCMHIYNNYKVAQIWPGQIVTCLHTNSPGHIWTILYIRPSTSQHSVRFRGPCVWFVTCLIFYGEEVLAPRPTLKLEDHPYSAVRGLLFQYIRSYPPYLETVTPTATWGRTMPWWQGPTTLSNKIQSHHTVHIVTTALQTF
jgi:hypothetical protein